MEPRLPGDSSCSSHYEGEAGARREETDCVAREHDLVAGPLSDIYGRDRTGSLSVFQVSR